MDATLKHGGWSDSHERCGDTGAESDVYECLLGFTSLRVAFVHTCCFFAFTRHVTAVGHVSSLVSYL